MKIGYVEQEIAASAAAAIEFVLDGDAELRSVLAAIADAEAARCSRWRSPRPMRRCRASTAIARGRAPRRSCTVSDSRRRIISAQVAEFSGGWRVRLGMARALCSRADLLLLDEPTNHLDLDAIVWLEEWLTAFSGTLLMISHDREFLDAIIDRVLHIENRAIRAYSGNYSQFEQKRAEELALQQALQARQVRRVAEITSFVNRFRASATKSRQAQSRLKMLERMERIVPAHVDSPFEFEFAAPLKTPRPLLTVEDAACGYGNTRIVERHQRIDRPAGSHRAARAERRRQIDLDQDAGGRGGAARGQAHTRRRLERRLLRAAAAGAAAAGLRRLLAPAQSGRRGFRARATKQRVRDHLGRFGFEGDRAFEPVGRFSGGEKARLTLALLVARRPNLLLLDEPTNHLDIDMRHALTVALQSFEGGLVIVSHDRHLIKTVADSLWLVADGKLRGVRRRPGRLSAMDEVARRRPAAADADSAAQGAPKRSRSKGAPKDAPNRAPIGRAAPRNRGDREAHRRRSPPSDAQVEEELCNDPMNRGAAGAIRRV